MLFSFDPKTGEITNESEKYALIIWRWTKQWTHIEIALVKDGKETEHYEFKAKDVLAPDQDIPTYVAILAVNRKLINPLFSRFNVEVRP